MVGDSSLGAQIIGDRETREHWRINGDPVALDAIEETRTFDTLEITFHAPLEAVQQVLRPLRPDAGSVEILDRSDGGFIAVDTADGNNTHMLEAPSSRHPVRRQFRWLVGEYDEEMIDRQGEKYEVELELVPAQSKRQYAGHSDETAATDEWLLEFDAGSIATAAVSSEINESSTDGIETLGLELILSPAQVRKIEESVRKLSAVQVVEQHDGSSRAVDNSPGRVNVFQLTPPNGGDKTVDPGHYVANDFEVSWEGHGAYQVSLEALEIDALPAFGDSFSDTDFDKTSQ